MQLVASVTLTITAVSAIRICFNCLFQQPRKDFELIEIMLQESGQKLREVVASMCGMDPSMVKLISGGRVIQDGDSLQDQGVRVSNVVNYLRSGLLSSLHLINVSYLDSITGN